MQLTINGTPRTFNPTISNIIVLLEHLGIDPKLVVIELNQQILSAQHYQDTFLRDGDNIELIQFVGGG